jgi:hypothetical protein
VSCPDQTANLIAGQHIDAGSVSITNDGDSLLVTITADAPWLLSEAHVYAGFGPAPTNRRGIVVPGQFPYKAAFSPATSSYSLAIALSDLDGSCGETLTVVTHAVVVKLNGGTVVEEQTAFGDGTPFSDPRWGFSASYEICCDTEQCENEDASFWAGQSQYPVFGPDSTLCYTEPTSDIPTFAEILASASTDAFTVLAQEFIAAKQNQLCTAFDKDVGSAMVAANVILSDCVVSAEEAADAAAITAVLHAYNSL